MKFDHLFNKKDFDNFVSTAEGKVELSIVDLSQSADDFCRIANAHPEEADKHIYLLSNIIIRLNNIHARLSKI